jgi:hypothetical protein
MKTLKDNEGNLVEVPEWIYNEVHGCEWCVLATINGRPYIFPKQ